MNEQGSHKQIIRSSAIIGGASLLNIIIGLIRIKIVALLLGPAGVGLVGILQNLLNTASTIFALGSGNAGTRQVAEAHNTTDRSKSVTVRRALFTGALVLSFAGFLSLMVSNSFLANNVLAGDISSSTVTWIAFGVAFSILAGAQRAYLAGVRHVSALAKISVFSSLFSSIAGIGFIIFLGEKGLVALVILAPFFGFFVGRMYVRRAPKPTSVNVTIKEIRTQWLQMAKLGSSFMIAGVTVTLGQLTVRSLVQNQFGADDLGYFQAAWTISMTYIAFILSAMGTDYYPRLSAAIHDPDKANRLVNEQTEVVVLMAGPILLLTLALAPWLITLLYTAEFSPSAEILRWQILGDVLKIISWPLGFIILASGKGLIFMTKEILVMSTFVFVTWLLLPVFEVEATGMAFLVMYSINLPILVFIAKKMTGFTWNQEVRRDLILIALASIITFCAGWYDDVLGALIGIPLFLTFAMSAASRLSKMTDLKGPVRKIMQFFRRSS